MFIPLYVYTNNSGVKRQMGDYKKMEAKEMGAQSFIVPPAPIVVVVANRAYGHIAIQGCPPAVSHDPLLHLQRLQPVTLLT
jgi:hypothetical protein